MLLSLSCTTGKTLVKKEASLEKITPGISLDQLLNVIKKREESVKGFKALVDVNFKLKENGNHSVHKLKGALFFEYGGAWRFKGFDLLGRTLVDLLVTKEGFQIHLPAQEEYHSGTLDQLQPIQLSSSVVLPHHLLTMVNALGPLSLEPLEIPMMQREKNTFILSLLQLQGDRAILNRRVFFQGKDLDMKQREIFNTEGTLEMTLLFNQYENLNGLRFPFQVTAKNGNNQAALTFNEVKTNPVFEKKDFQMVQILHESNP